MESPADIIARLTGSTPATPITNQFQTDSFGHILPSSSHALNIGNIPVVSDTFLFEKQQTFNRSKTTERNVHACGSGALGHFIVTHDVSDLCKADFLSNVGKQTPVFARFSTTTYGREFPDVARNIRGFALKFYTSDGNYDLLGLNWPVFFTRDPMKGPDVIRSQTRNPASGLLDYDAMFDYFSSNPESLHAATMHFSERGTPIGWRCLDGYGVHTYKWVNSKNEQVYVKYHWFPEEKPARRFFTNEESLNLYSDPDFSKRDLFDHLASGKECYWRFHLQIMTLEESKSVDFDPFDCTKVWPHSQFPLREFGRLVLNKNPENFHRDVEQACFNPGSMVPGIEPSPDALLQFRSIFYTDAQIHRVGTNRHQVPINCPFMAKYMSPQSRDSMMRSDSNGANLPSVMSASRSLKTDSRVDVHPQQMVNAVMSRQTAYKHEGQESEYNQVRELFERVMDDRQRQQLFINTAFYLNSASKNIQKNYLAQLKKISSEYENGVKRAMQQSSESVKQISEERAVEAMSAGIR
ncbi:hypothetical protein RCL1_004564 [Eukaryota sp. TZLM3-RCL]